MTTPVWQVGKWDLEADLAKIDGTESWVREGWDRMLLDPARSGAAEVVERMQLFDPKRIVYVSCNPATLARDLGLMQAHYTVAEVQPVDMFPHTYHVEAVARLERKKRSENSV